MTDVRPKHSPIGASSRPRWAKCPGSIAMSEGFPNVSSLAAQEGTAAHEIVSIALTQAFSANIRTRDLLEETMKALVVYTDYVEDLKNSNSDNLCWIEHSFDMKDIYKGLYGTADCVIFNKEERLLHVIDYKHGRGLVVEVENNLQLEYYALGAMSTLDLGAGPIEVQMTIVQPRAYHPDGVIRSWKVSALHFLDVEADVVQEAKETAQKDALLLSGSHCMFCLGKSKCPQYRNSNAAHVKSDFSFYKDPKKDFKALDTPQPSGVNSKKEAAQEGDAPHSPGSTDFLDDWSP